MIKTLSLLLAATLSLAAAWEQGKVVTVIDGDTVMMRRPYGAVVKCRLIGLDTFETKVNHRAFIQLATLKRLHPRRKHSIKEVMHWGYEAKKFAVAHVLGKTVQYHSYGTDQYNRELIYIKDLNYLLIRNGLAVEYPTNLLSPKRRTFLLGASKEANREHRGFFHD